MIRYTTISVAHILWEKTAAHWRVVLSRTLTEPGMG